MTSESLFSLTGNIFILAWIALFFAAFLGENARWRSRLLVAGGRIAPLLLLTIFAAGVFIHHEM